MEKSTNAFILTQNYNFIVQHGRFFVIHAWEWALVLMGRLDFLLISCRNVTRWRCIKSHYSNLDSEAVIIFCVVSRWPCVSKIKQIVIQSKNDMSCRKKIKCQTNLHAISSRQSPKRESIHNLMFTYYFWWSYKTLFEKNTSVQPNGPVACTAVGCLQIACKRPWHRYSRTY